jgi:hypothetical protein
MTRKYGFRLLAISAALLAVGLALALLSGASAAQTVTIIADCTSGQVGTIGTSENCLSSFSLRILAFGDFDGPVCGRERWRGYLEFPLGAIPSGSNIIDAQLSTLVVMPYSPTVVTPVSIGVHRITQDWDPDLGSFVWPGPTYDPTVDTQAVSTPLMWYTWDVAPIVRDWMRDSPNHGVAFVAENEGTNVNAFGATPICEEIPVGNGMGLGSLEVVEPQQQNEAILEVTYEEAARAQAGVPEIPEASSLFLMGSGLAGFGGYALTRLRALRRSE